MFLFLSQFSDASDAFALENYTPQRRTWLVKATEVLRLSRFQLQSFDYETVDLSWIVVVIDWDVGISKLEIHVN